MAKTRLTDEGLVLTNDNGVDVMIKANHAATSDKYVLPPTSDGTIGTGSGGGIESIVAGSGVTVDATDPANPIVSASGGGGGTTVLKTSDQDVGESTDTLDNVLEIAVTETGTYLIEGFVKAANETTRSAAMAKVNGSWGQLSDVDGVVIVNTTVTDKTAFTQPTAASRQAVSTAGTHFRLYATITVTGSCSFGLRHYDSNEGTNNVTRGALTVTKIS